MKRGSVSFSEAGVGLLVLVAVFALINPTDVLMGPAIEMGLVAILAVATILFAVFIWREQPADERETYIGQRTARIAFFVGGGVLVIGTFIQALGMHVDPWLPATLGAMVITKLMVNVWMREK